MSDTNPPRWLRDAVLVGALYVGISIVSGALAGGAASAQVRFFWRLSAFVVSGIVLGAHIGHEHFRLRNTARPTAWHAAVAAALGGFGLALAANVHDVGSAAGYRPRMLVALAAWPLLTGVPAFLAGLVVAALLDRWRSRDGNMPREET